jgi:hypothetical protein
MPYSSDTFRQCDASASQCSDRENVSVRDTELTARLVNSIAKERYLTFHFASHSGERISGIHADAQRSVGFHTKHV